MKAKWKRDKNNGGMCRDSSDSEIDPRPGKDQGENASEGASPPFRGDQKLDLAEDPDVGFGVAADRPILIHALHLVRVNLAGVGNIVGSENRTSRVT